MQKEHLPIYKIQEFKAKAGQEEYLYLSTLADHLQEHLFIREPHKHNFYIIIYFTRGSGTHTIDFQRYEVQPGLAFFMIPGQVHSWELSEDADGFVVFFSSEYYFREYPHGRLSHFPFFNALIPQPVLAVPQEEAQQLHYTWQRLQQEYLGQQYLRDQMLSRYLDVLLIQLTRIHQTQHKVIETVGGELSLLQALENLIEQHYRAHLPVTFYAEQLNITPKHLNEVCKRSLGKTTGRLIQERLVLEAQRLLVHSQLTSTQIATELGFFDNTYFFRFFKKHTGLTPEQFRNAH